MLTAPRVLRVTLSATLLALAVVSCGDDPPDPVVGPSPVPTPLRVNSVSPSTIAAGSSTTVTIMGSGFQQGATLTVGGAAVPVQILSATNARATVPPHTAGAVDVVMTNPDGERGQLTNGLHYVDVPVRLEISGTTVLRAVGETTQLTATATLADGSTRDVTRDARWFSTFPWIATVNAEGIATATGLGLTTVSVQYPVSPPSLFRSGPLSVTPAGSYALSGRVREPGSGSVAGARVVHVDSGQSVNSSRDGYFWFGGLTGRPRLMITSPGFEDSERDGIADEFFDAPLQRVVGLTAGGSPYTSTLAPNDVDLDVGGGARCQPCRLIRVKSATPGIARVTLTWTGTTPLQIWIGGVGFAASGNVREITADLPVGSEDTLVVVGRVQSSTTVDYIPITVTVRQ